MRKRAGFTLVETLLALSIAAGLLLLASGTEKRFIRPIQRDPIAWYQFVQVLEQPGRYQYRAVQGDSLTLRDLQTHKDRQIRLDQRQTLKMTNDDGQGYYPLLRHVTAIQWQPLRGGVVQLQLKQEGLPWQTTLVDLRGIKDS